MEQPRKVEASLAWVNQDLNVVNLEAELIPEDHSKMRLQSEQHIHLPLIVIYLKVKLRRQVDFDWTLL